MREAEVKAQIAGVLSQYLSAPRQRLLFLQESPMG
jgi:hypothetical protein